MVHDHHASDSSLRIALVLTSGYAFIELAGGLWAHSLALLADAGHMLSDIAALSLASIANRIAMKPAHEGMSYGFGQARVLAAQLNGLGLWLLCGWIIWEAVHRLMEPNQVKGGILLAVALLGLLINLGSLYALHGHHDLNTRAAFWHVFGDMLGSLTAIIAGIVILLTEWYPIDPILSFVVAAILAWGGWKLIRETTLHLMVATPAHVDLQQIHDLFRSLEGVRGLHHIHVWVLPSGETAISAHVEITDMQAWASVLSTANERLHAMGITHATLQPEPQGCVHQTSVC
ncbi:MAG: cation transporter [Zetaproteobacteria bacterium]|nr:MAG: cation transporter [Zetaproteobacteria bacterium]